MTAPLEAKAFAAQTGVSRETVARLEIYAGLLIRWSARVNLVGRNTISDLWRRHFLDSAQLHALVPAAARSVADIGSGAGFPGLVLSLLGVPGVELIEADGRKCAFLREAVRLTGATATVRNIRAEALAARPRDIVTARACAPLDKLLALALPLIGSHTRCLFLKGEKAEEEVTEARRHWRMKLSSHRSVADPRGVVLCLDEVARAFPAG